MEVEKNSRVFFCSRSLSLSVLSLSLYISFYKRNTIKKDAAAFWQGPEIRFRLETEKENFEV